jgi:hypothetical protein
MYVDTFCGATFAADAIGKSKTGLYSILMSARDERILLVISLKVNSTVLIISSPFASKANLVLSPRIPVYPSELIIFSLGLKYEMKDDVIVVDIVEREFCVSVREDAATELICQLRFVVVLCRERELTAKELRLDRVLVTCV